MIEAVKVTSQGSTRVRLSGGIKKVDLNDVLYVFMVSHIRTFASSPCYDCHTVLFTKTNLTTYKNNALVNIGKHTRIMYSLSCRLLVNVLWPLLKMKTTGWLYDGVRLAHADRRCIKQMETKGATIVVSVKNRSVRVGYSAFVHGTMKNTSMRLRICGET